LSSYPSACTVTPSLSHHSFIHALEPPITNSHPLRRGALSLSLLLVKSTMVSKSSRGPGMTAGGSEAEEALLLPEHEVGDPAGAAPGNASVLGAVFNVSTSVVGAGIMSIPAAMRVLGVAPALALIVGVALLANVAVDFMLRYTRGTPSYAALMGGSFGRAGAKLLNVFIAFNCVGTLTVYLIIIDSLRYTSALSILLAAVFMLITMGIAVYTVFTGTAKMPRMLPDFSTLASPFELFTAVPVIVVAFTFHFNVHPIRAELSKTSDMKSAVRISLVLCAAIYAAVGFFGFLLFGDATMPDVLANFDRSSGSGVPQALNDAARLSYALHLVLVFPLLHYSLRVNVDELLFPGRRPLAADTRRFVALTAVLMGLLYALAIAIPSIWTLFQYSGSTFAVCISLIFPGAIVLRDVHGIAKRKDKAMAAMMITLAVITSSIAIASNVMSSIKGEVKGVSAGAS
uniref:Amino acid transporter transmembrane domain-containing protein n=2 Tax=Aegilops tauschii subsp. strangulata TaxID=200361 RepID=A0A453FUA3_AEGTS